MTDEQAKPLTVLAPSASEEREIREIHIAQDRAGECSCGFKGICDVLLCLALVDAERARTRALVEAAEEVSEFIGERAAADLVRVDADRITFSRTWFADLTHAVIRLRALLTPEGAAPAARLEHVCGLQGFGALGDECPACIPEGAARERR